MNGVSESTIKKNISMNDICQVKVDASSEAIFSLGLLPPILLLTAFLFLLQRMAKSLREEAESSNPYSDPFKKIWLSGPIVATVLYFLMIYFGRMFMKNRKEMQIKPYIFTYNLYQCVLNIWTVAAMIYEVYNNPWFKAPWGNYPQNHIDGFRISFLVWVHYNNKFVELLDTVWMVLRKKNNQISFLHCYHHILLIWSWYLAVKTEAGGDCYFGASVNSFIHIIMYGYYTLALLNIPCPWKKMITACQMVQFCVVFCHSSYVVWKGNMPLTLPLLQGFVMVNMLILFGQFYVKSYGKKSGKSE